MVSVYAAASDCLLHDHADKCVCGVASLEGARIVANDDVHAESI